MSSDDINLEIGKRLKAAREKTGLLQPDFAVRLGISPRAYGSYERGERTLTVEALKALYDLFHIDPVWILSGPGADPRTFKTPTRADILVEIIVKVEEHLTRHRLRLPVEKKARLIALLNQYFQAKGKVEVEHVEQVLAASSM
ncbi:MAG: helix-turn-helix transcriptional regulator [Nevskia sp.]|nr:helix-turn-helix transcriptional regulator [Nevskia sp.]